MSDKSQNTGTLSGRIGIMAVSFLGTLGLAVSALYLTASVLNFVKGFSVVSRFMIGTEDKLSYGFTLLVVPYFLIMTHLYFRSQLGHWLFHRGDFDLAKRFCEKRQTHNILRSRGEALANKSILLALLIRDADWVEALAFFGKGEPRTKNPFFWRWQGWGAELFWRLDKTSELENLFKKHGSSGKLAERYEAIHAHYLFEKGDTVEAQAILENQSWNKIPERVAIVESIVNEGDLNEDAWKTYLNHIPSAANEFAILVDKPVELRGEDPRTIRLITEQVNRD